MRRQVFFKDGDESNPKSLNVIASRFRITSSKACHFALFYVYGLEGKRTKNLARHSPKVCRNVFLYFEESQTTAIDELIHRMGISFSELCKRAISTISHMIENYKLRMDDPKVLNFFD